MNTTNKSVLCLYHRPDFDGHCSAAIVEKWCDDNEYVFISKDVNYDDNEVEICNTLHACSDVYDTLVIVDFSLTKKQLDIAYSAFKEVIWIDHRISAIESAKNTEAANLKGIRSTEKAACELTWNYFFPNNTLPLGVELLGKYDRWDKSDIALWNNTILPFQYGLKINLDTSLERDTVNWNTLLNNAFNVNEIIAIGKSLILSANKMNKVLIDTSSYRITWEGLECLAVNASVGGSNLFDSVTDPSIDLFVTWRYIKNKWVIGLYCPESKDTDCSIIAKKHGGGGHKKASGFQLDYCPLSLFKHDGLKYGNYK